MNKEIIDNLFNKKTYKIPKGENDAIWLFEDTEKWFGGSIVKLDYSCTNCEDGKTIKFRNHV